jgi:hypothetical protein
MSDGVRRIDLSKGPFVGPPIEVTMHRQWEPGIVSGLVPYTRRRVGDRTRIYFRNAAGFKAGSIDCDAEIAAVIKPGQFVTLDFSPSV